MDESRVSQGLCSDRFNKGIGWSLKGIQSNRMLPSSFLPIAAVIFARACELIPHFQNPAAIKPHSKDRFKWEYAEKFRTYDHFHKAMHGNHECKELLALWFLKGICIKGICEDFYERHVEDDPVESKVANVLLEYLDYYAAQW